MADLASLELRSAMLSGGEPMAHLMTGMHKATDHACRNRCLQFCQAERDRCAQHSTPHVEVALYLADAQPWPGAAGSSRA